MNSFIFVFQFNSLIHFLYIFFQFLHGIWNCLYFLCLHFKNLKSLNFFSFQIILYFKIHIIKNCKFNFIEFLIFLFDYLFKNYQLPLLNFNLLKDLILFHLFYFIFSFFEALSSWYNRIFMVKLINLYEPTQLLYY